MCRIKESECPIQSKIKQLYNYIDIKKPPKLYILLLTSSHCPINICSEDKM